ncbi:LOW QUALITY PROTEIN: transport and golgi organization 1 [Andrena cerasifolii]|uniref:LOW QUALITY PROTEIN: transport and golgi organization 1 n=1 Tax=Andrena cerasifolii TaxID=2819439 RepID=UPI004037C4E0
MWNFNSGNMMKRNLFIYVAFLLIAILFSAISQCSSALSNKRLCYDHDCSEPVSLARTSIRYNPNEPGILPFDVNVKVKVYSKEAGNRTDLWGVEINGKRGYAPKKFLKEYRILHKNLTYEVPTNRLPHNNNVSDTELQPKKDNDKAEFVAKDTKASNAQTNNFNLESTEELPVVSDVTPPYEIIDGTTFHLGHNEPTVQPASVTEVVQTTAVPNKQDAVHNAGPSSSSAKVKSNIFTAGNKLQKEIFSDKVESNEQQFPETVDIKDFVTSSEDMLHVPEIAGIQVPALDVNESLKTNDLSKVERVTQNVKNDTTIETKEAQSSEESSNITVSETSTPHDAEEAVNKNVSHSNVNDTSALELEENRNTDTIIAVAAHDAKTDTKPVQNMTKSEINEAETLNNVTQVKTEEMSTFHDTEEAPNKNVTHSNVNEKSAIELEKKRNTDTIKAVAADDAKTDTRAVQSTTKSETKDAETLNNVTQLKTEEISTPINKNVSHSNVNDKLAIELEKSHNTDTIKAVAADDVETDTKAVQSIAKSQVKDTGTLQNVTKLKTEEIPTSHVTEEASNKNVTHSNVSDTSAIELEKKHNTDTIKAVAADDAKTDKEAVQNMTKSEINEAETLNNVTQLGTEEGESKQDSKASGNKLIISDNTDTHVSPLSIKSYVLDAAKLTLSSNSDEKITGEQVHNSSLEISSREQNVPIPSKSAEVKVTPSTTTVSPVPQNVNQNLKENNNAILVGEVDSNGELQKDTVQDKRYQSEHHTEKEISEIVNKTTIADNILENETNVHINVSDDSHSIEVPLVVNEIDAPTIEESNLSTPELLYSDETSMISENIESINEFHNRNLLNADIGEQLEIENLVNHETDPLKNEALTEHEGDISVQDKVLHEDSNIEDIVFETTSEDLLHQVQVVPSPHVCVADNDECSFEDNTQSYFSDNEGTSQNSENALMEGIKIESNYWLTLIYVSITATTTLIFSLGYYYIENMRRDGKLIARINKLEKDLLISTKECTMLNDNLKLTKDKLTSIEDESFGSNEMVLSLKADLEASQNAKAELEKQVDLWEKDLESATEAGLELERMLREVLSSNNDVNPLAQSVEDLQRRLNAQQAANESLTNVLNLKTQELEFDKFENESLSAELVSLKKKYEDLEVELTRVAENLKVEENSKNSIEKTLTDKVQQLEMQIKEISTEKTALLKEIKGKEVEIKDLADVINRLNCNNLDLDKLYEVSRIKAEATALLEEGNELKIRLTDVEGAHNLLEEHMKLVKEEVVTLSKQCKIAEKEKKDAETRLEVLSSFFQEKEAQRQKEEAVWLQQQGEVLSTVERIQTMQNEIQNYKQQIEMLKREILDQEREYKNQMSVLETKAHEQWVIARQVERRLEESKVEAGQLRNRLTLIEKNINDADSEAKLHRLEANGETATSPPLFIGPESSNSPVMFSGSTNVPPPPPPSYLHSLFPPYLPPPLPNAPGVPSYEVSQRPPPLGGRLSSPPPMPLHPPASSRYDNAGSPPPPMSPHLLPHFDHRSPPHLFASDHIHPPPPPPGSILPPPLGATHSWGEESLPPPRNSGFHPPRRERVRNHKGSLHSSGESLDKTHHNSKV